MLQPNQVQEIRNSLKNGEHPKTIDGIAISSFNIDTPDDTRNVTPLRSRGLFYPPNKVIGQPDIPACMNKVVHTTILDTPTQVISLENATIIGNKGVITKKGHLYNSSVVNKSNINNEICENQKNHDGFVIDAMDSEYICYFASRPMPKHINRHVMFLPNWEPTNYGSFIFRLLPQLIHLSKYNISFDFYIAERTTWLLEALDALGLPKKPVFNVREVSGDTFSQVTFIDYFEAEGYLDQYARNTSLEIAQSFYSRSGASHELRSKIYISRSLSNISRPWYRLLLNEADVESAFSDAGFYIVYPETLTFVEQMKLFAGAKNIVGLSGSGMLNTIFSIPGSKIVDIESFTWNVGQHSKFYSSCGMNYALAFGSLTDKVHNPALSSWCLRMDAVSEIIAWLRKDSL